MIIRHHMKDGTVRESVEGVVIPAGSDAYALIKEIKKGRRNAPQEQALPRADGSRSRQG